MDHYLYSQHQEHQKSILLPNRIEHSTIPGPGTETYSERITTRPMRLFRAQNISMFQKLSFLFWSDVTEMAAWMPIKVVTIWSKIAKDQYIVWMNHLQSKLIQRI